MERNAIAALLPDVMRATATPGSTLSALLTIIESLHLPSERALASIDDICDPRRCPRRFLPMLIRWLDLDRIFCDDQAVGIDDDQNRTSLSGDRIRELLAVTVRLAKQRGTVNGLKSLLSTATGLSDIRIEENVSDQFGQPKPYHVCVEISVAGIPHRQLIERIVIEEKPAHVTASVKFIDQTQGTV